MLNEKSEPLVLAISVLKAGLSLREYVALVSRENINVNVNMEIYMLEKQRQEFESSFTQLVRS